VTVDEDPPRWSDGVSDAPRELVKLLQHGRRESPNSLSVLRVGARLREAKGSLIPASWLPALAVATSLGGVALAATLAHQGEPPARPAVRPIAQPSPVARKPASPQTAPELRPAPVEAVVEERKETSPSRSPAPTRLPSEAMLLRAARRALSEDPKRTLALMSEHRTRYPHGILSQEREFLAQQALKALGRTEEAAHQAKQFQSSFEDSPYSQIPPASSKTPTRQ
jgi:hypothetical protein